MTKLVEPLYCSRCKEEVKKEPPIREHWCYRCKVWTVGIRLINENSSHLKYDDMGCYLERE